VERVRIGEDDARGHYLAVSEYDTSRRAVANEHAFDRGTGPDLASVRVQDGRESLAERAHAAPDVAEAPQVLVNAGGQVVGL
jgi:hypothetical protein